MKYSVYLVLFILGSVQLAFSQYNSPRDCEGAIPVLAGYYDLPLVPTTINPIINEINPQYSCLSGGEINGVWFEFMISDSGVLSFNIIPYHQTDDYDWALFDLTSNNCSDISAGGLEVSCNYSNSVTNYGITGANGGGNNQDESTINVISGQRFKLYISNFNGSPEGYQINMAASTCTFDQTVALAENEIGTKVKIGPNPTQGLINITFDHTILGDITDIKIIDLLGKTILQKSSGFSPILSFDLSNQPAGLYFIQISTHSEQLSFRLIVQ